MEGKQFRIHGHERYSSMSSMDGRPYDCTFCKRGFSTAQALGGHMNIHRRARAKLKQQSGNNLYASLYPSPLNFQANSGANCISESMPGRRDQFQEERLVKTSLIKHCNSRHEDFDKVQGTELRQLQLFVERSNGVGDDGEWQEHYQNHEEMTKRPAGKGSDGEDLDLELRLGPEPQRMWWCS